MKYITVAIIYTIFSVVSALAGILALFMPSRISNVTRAMNCTAAALLGWDGRSPISQECGRDMSCKFCKVLCKILHQTLEKDHCEKEAK